MFLTREMPKRNPKSSQLKKKDAVKWGIDLLKRQKNKRRKISRTFVYTTKIRKSAWKRRN